MRINNHPECAQKDPECVQKGLKCAKKGGRSMKRWTSGMLAISLAGHDKGNLYVVLEENPSGEPAASPAAGITEGMYLLLADGKRRTLEHPKRKKAKHVQLITHLPAPLLAQMDEFTLDAHVRKIIREYQEQN